MKSALTNADRSLMMLPVRLLWYRARLIWYALLLTPGGGDQQTREQQAGREGQQAQLSSAMLCAVSSNGSVLCCKWFGTLQRGYYL
jgi:hypothetical protein